MTTSSEANGTSNVQVNGSSTSTTSPLPSTLNDSISSIAAALNASPDAENELSGEDLATLLRQLDDAEGVAGGVEDRLDAIISNLDTLLESIQGDSSTTGADASGEKLDDGSHA
jgi:hypothetical protein